MLRLSDIVTGRKIIISINGKDSVFRIWVCITVLKKNETVTVFISLKNCF